MAALIQAQAHAALEVHSAFYAVLEAAGHADPPQCDDLLRWALAVVDDDSREALHRLRSALTSHAVRTAVDAMTASSTNTIATVAGLLGLPAPPTTTTPATDRQHRRLAASVARFRELFTEASALFL